MIRSTQNESISSQSKKRHSGGSLSYSGTKGQSYETIIDNLGVILERRDEFDTHSALESDFPSNYHNGQFE